jgi:ectoine hydroxylase-related dioxygenase (phytanoyl-CoA dioxygenase family)
MLTEDQVATYDRDGFILVEDVLSPDLLGRVGAVVDGFVARAKGLTAPNEVYDLEDTHTPDEPRVRRLKDPVNRDPIFWEVIRTPSVIEPLMQLIGPDIRLFGSKLNMKAAGYGAAVEWHQDWAFYPHTNDDLLAIGIMLDDVTLENGPLMVVPGSHKGPIYDHHSDGYFVGAIAAPDQKAELSAAVPITGRAGSMSVHHVRALHGSSLNLSGKPRRLLFYEISAADAFPIWSDVIALKYRNFDHFNEQIIVGEPTLVPRMAALPVRATGPFRGAKVDGIYALQGTAKQRYFGTYREKVAQGT